MESGNVSFLLNFCKSPRHALLEDVLTEAFPFYFLTAELWGVLEEALLKNPDALFVDIGANLGMCSLTAAKMGHRVIAFDPLKANVNKICASVAENDLADNIRVYFSALLDAPGEYVSFPRRFHSVAGTEIRRSSKPLTGEYGVNYSKTITLDDVQHEFRGRKLIIKMDIEGFECRVIAGGLRALASADSVEMVVSEWFQVARSCEDDGDQYVRNLRSLGLEPYSVDGERKLGSWRQWYDHDLVFRRSPV